MNIRDALDQVDALKPNQFDEQQKIYWLSQVDQRIYNDVVLRHEMDESMPATFGGYPPDVDQDTRLLAGAPFDALYRWWLEAMIDLGNGELGKYQNSMLLFNSAWNDFAKDYRRKHMPLGQQKIGFTAGGRKACGATGDAMDRLTQATQDANKAAFSAQLIAQTLQEKLASGELKGEDGSDASVTPENIQSALGYTPVKDVQVAGVSVLTNGVATIPLAGYNRLGVVQLDPAGFAAASVDGKLALVPPTDAQISTHTYTQRPITPSCMDYAVTAAMTDGKGPAWTAAQQAAARERMGIPGDYELIEEITLTESSTVMRTNEPDGTPYKFDKLKYCVIVPAAAAAADLYVNALIYSDTGIYAISYTALSSNVDNVVAGEMKKEGATWECCQPSSGRIGPQAMYKTAQEYLSIPNAYGEYIAKFFINVALPTDTKIYIYGVRV